MESAACREGGDRRLQYQGWLGVGRPLKGGDLRVTASGGGFMRVVKLIRAVRGHFRSYGGALNNYEFPRTVQGSGKSAGTARLAGRSRSNREIRAGSKKAAAVSQRTQTSCARVGCTRQLDLPSIGEGAVEASSRCIVFDRRISVVTH